MTEYRLDLYDADGTLQATLTGFTSLSYKKVVNEPGVLSFSPQSGAAISTVLLDKWQAEVWRRPPGQAWARDFVGVHRISRWDMNPATRLTSTCPGLMSVLGWRHVLWYAETADRSLFSSQKAETIMKQIVLNNCGSGATAASGRLRDGTIPGLSVQTDGAHGATLDWACAYDNVLATLQKLAGIAGGDFDLVKTGAGTSTFSWYTGQLGTDRSATVKFSTELGNMREPVYEENHALERTAALVAGQGEGSARATVIRTGDDYDATDNNIEVFVDGRNSATSAGLDALGDQKLSEVKAKRSFGFKVVQAPKTLYGVDYFLGDLVTAVNPFTGASSVQKVMSVTVKLGEGGDENVDVELAP